MISRCLFLFAFLASAGAAGAASTEISPDKPIINFSLPEFTSEGYRTWLVRGSEARYATQGMVNIKGLNLTVFTGLPDGKVETLILSPSALIRYTDMMASGKESIRIINDRFEATGITWNYAHQEKPTREEKVSIAGNVRVVLHTELKDILK